MNPEPTANASDTFMHAVKFKTINVFEVKYLCVEAITIDHLASSEPKDIEESFRELRRNIDKAKICIYSAAKRECDPAVKGSLLELLGESKDVRFVRAYNVRRFSC